MAAFLVGAAYNLLPPEVEAVSGSGAHANSRKQDKHARQTSLLNTLLGATVAASVLPAPEDASARCARCGGVLLRSRPVGTATNVNYVANPP